MIEQTPVVHPTSSATMRESLSADRQPFVPPAVTELGRMSDLTLLGGSL